MSVEEDYFIPTRRNVSSRIETFAGGSYTGDIDDVKYLRDKLFSAIKIPASYLSTAEKGAGGQDNFGTKRHSVCKNHSKTSKSNCD
jgi:hypothetical protein